ncbi:MAG: sigma-54 factor interaction domain-containing protein [Planctomycetia bacterium]|nr:sigma-54 factor interaction domain-containing protein [Planctomycetia bacterium]
MPLFSPAERRFAESVSRLAYCNPFLPERIELEREALGEEFEDTQPYWSRQVGMDEERSNILRLSERVEQLVARVQAKLATDSGHEADRTLYEDLICYVLYYRYWPELSQAIETNPAGGTQKPRCWKRFAADFRALMSPGGRELPLTFEPDHLFACLYQIRRAFHHVFDFIFGASAPTGRLRAAIWQSIFTHDMRRYRRGLYRRMGDITTLITGPSGTGKELVARAVGQARYVPFDAAREQFAADFGGLFHPLNLSALSPTLVESELFGHCRGAFTGAVGDRRGWLETCPALGTVFLDEIGELNASIQVKLLRVLQERTFQRLGETEPRRFQGKIIAATNRDLAAEMQAGNFREDFYYRLCADMITTPLLRDQLAASAENLRDLVQFIARRETEAEEAEALTDEVVDWIEEKLGLDYPWPGNIRELEQCVRNVMIRREYRPAQDRTSPAADLAAAIEAGTLSADDLLKRYCTITYARTGSYEATARLLKLDRRTVKSKVDEK